MIDTDNENPVPEATNPAFEGAPPATGGPQETVQEGYERVKNRLQWLEDQKKEDEENYPDKLKQAKEDYRLEWERNNCGLLSSDDSPTLQDRLVDESAKIIQYLREDNTRVRGQISKVKSQIRKERETQEKLMEANASVKKMADEMTVHVKGLTQVNAKLNANVEAFKNHLATMKEDFKKRDSHYLAEAHARKAYERCLARIVPSIEKKAKHEPFVEQVLELSKNGTKQANEVRDAALAKVGATALPTVGESELRRGRNSDKGHSRAKSSFDNDSSDSDSDSDSDSE